MRGRIPAGRARTWRLVGVAVVACLLAGCADTETRSALAQRRPLDGRAGPFAQQLIVNAQQDGPVGRWEPLRLPEAGLDDDTRAQVEALRAIGYVGGSKPAASSGVQIHRPGAYPGLNLYSSGSAAEAFLIAMDGTELHRWSANFWDVWPHYPVEKHLATTQWWRRVALLENGDLLALFEGLGLVRLDRDSRVRWARPISAHHDLELLPNGDILVLTRDIALVPRGGRDIAIYEDYVERLDPQGRTRDRFSLLRAFEDSAFDEILERIDLETDPDVFHTNTLHVIRDSPYGPQSPFRDGNLFVSLRTLDVIAVVDPRSKRVVWAHHGGFRGQHDPTLLPNGHLLLFDNLGHGDASAVLEFDPTTLRAVWSYVGGPERAFFSEFCGTAERLPNGNTLITETDGGRAFEVTPERETVWEFYNPRRAGENGEFIASIAELIRIPADRASGWLRDPGSGSREGRGGATSVPGRARG